MLKMSGQSTWCSETISTKMDDHTCSGNICPEMDDHVKKRLTKISKESDILAKMNERSGRHPLKFNLR